MPNELLIRKLEQAIHDTEDIIDRDRKNSKTSGKSGKKGLCLQKVTDEVFKIDKVMEDCFKNNSTDTKTEYLGCITNASESVSNIYQNIIKSGECLKDNKVDRRKAIIYLGSLFHLAEVRNCLENNSYFETIGCIEEKFGWNSLPTTVTTPVTKVINKQNSKSKNKWKGKSKDKYSQKIKLKVKTVQKNKTKAKAKHNPKKLASTGWVPISKFTT